MPRVTINELLVNFVRQNVNVFLGGNIDNRLQFSPCNPTGSLYSPEGLHGIADLAAEEDIYILSDEIYEKLVYGDAQHVSIASLSKEAYDLTITVNGFSKSYAMTGWRLGYLAAPEAVAK